MLSVWQVLPFHAASHSHEEFMQSPLREQSSDDLQFGNAKDFSVSVKRRRGWRVVVCRFSILIYRYSV